MKTANYLITAVLGTVLLTAAGCGNNTSNPPVSTNAVSATMPSTNDMIVNAPPVSLTNAPMLTNSITDTNR